jgi:hypothetical protein
MTRNRFACAANAALQSGRVRPDPLHPVPSGVGSMLADRPQADGRSRALVLGRPEEHPAARRELRFVPDHAGRDAVDIGNLRAAQTKRIAGAGLLLILGIGVADRRQHRKRKYGCEYQTALDIPGSRHESPHIVDDELWVKSGGLASSRRSTSGDINATLASRCRFQDSLAPTPRSSRIFWPLAVTAYSRAIGCRRDLLDQAFGQWTIEFPVLLGIQVLSRQACNIDHCRDAGVA